MAGNEKKVCEFLFEHLGKIQLNHIGLIEEIAEPIKGANRYLPVKSIADINRISTSDSRKKADIYLNGRGISVKQTRGSFPFNRLQRKNLLAVYTSLNFSYPEIIIHKTDQEVQKFHQGLLAGRNQQWQTFFTEPDFKALLKFLMLEGSPNHGQSRHPAEFILEASKNIDKLELYSFDEYFERYKQELAIAIRRVWIGQMSYSEHKRAVGIARNLYNKPWVFDNVAGEPNPHSETGKVWRDNIPESARKTVYFLMIENISKS